VETIFTKAAKRNSAQTSAPTPIAKSSFVKRHDFAGFLKKNEKSSKKMSTTTIKKAIC
jgi:hypothetical protein